MDVKKFALPTALAVVLAFVMLATPVGATLLSYALAMATALSQVNSPFHVNADGVTYSLPTTYTSTGAIIPGTVFNGFSGTVSNPNNADTTPRSLVVTINQTLINGQSNTLNNGEFSSVGANLNGIPLNLTGGACTMQNSNLNQVCTFDALFIPDNSTFDVTMTPNVMLPSGNVSSTAGFQ